MQLQDNISSEFDRFSTNYTSDMQRFVPHYKELMLALVKYLPTGFNPKRILDLGCGTGNCTALLKAHFPDSEYTLVDASSEMIKICQDRFSSQKIQYQQSFFQELNFDSGSFDLIVAGFSLHHLKSEEKQALFPRMAQWMRKNGLFTYSDLMVDRKDDKLHNQLLEEWKQFTIESQVQQSEWDWLMEHYNTYDFPDDPHSQINWLNEAGFSKAEIVWQADKYWTNVLAGV